MPRIRGRKRRLRVVLVVAAALLALVASLGTLAWNRFVQETRLSWRKSCLSQVMLVLVTYDGSCEGLPNSVYVDAAGNVLGSWRFETLLYTGWSNWEEWPNADMDAPWDAPGNREIASDPFIYCFGNGVGEARLHTNVFAVTGPGTAFDPQRRHRLGDLPRNLIVLVEVARSGVHWMAPGDLSIDEIPESLTDGVDGDGFHVAFADGKVWFLRRDVPLEDVKKFFTIEGARGHDAHEILGEYVLRKKRE